MLAVKKLSNPKNNNKATVNICDIRLGRLGICAKTDQELTRMYMTWWFSHYLNGFMKIWRFRTLNRKKLSNPKTNNKATLRTLRINARGQKTRNNDTLTSDFHSRCKNQFKWTSKAQKSLTFCKNIDYIEFLISDFSKQRRRCFFGA